MSRRLEVWLVVLSEMWPKTPSLKNCVVIEVSAVWKMVAECEVLGIVEL